jgi:hypothetical protein
VFADRRRHKRYEAKGTATVYQGSNVLELPIRDISLSGIHLQTVDSTTLNVGSVCFVALPEHGKHDAIVVHARPQGYHLKFLTPEPDDVRSFIDACKR